MKDIRDRSLAYILLLKTKYIALGAVCRVLGHKVEFSDDEYQENVCERCGRWLDNDQHQQG
jgi:hypothetical protein